ncbi:MAG: histidine phosphatase family protein [Gammaproteobacteria bacterium]|nr:histidine phosphatase family protein [Gammaproteobacteria bacterium]
MLMRHAKSDWHSHISDMDRPLSESGVQEAMFMGLHLKQMDLIPDCMIVSGAQRAQETARLVLKNLAVPENHLIVDKELYLADKETLLEFIEVFAAENKRLMIVAHNPGMDDVVNYLSNRPPQLSRHGKLMETCAVACFRLDSIASIKKRRQGKLVSLLRPEDINENRKQ